MKIIIRCGCARMLKRTRNASALRHRERRAQEIVSYTNGLCDAFLRLGLCLALRFSVAGPWKPDSAAR